MPEREQSQIVRIIRIQAEPGQAAELERILPANVEGRLHGVDGVIGWYLCRPIDGDPDAYAVITIWRDKDALRAFAGVSTPPPAIHEDEPATELSAEQFELFGSVWR